MLQFFKKSGRPHTSHDKNASQAQQKQILSKRHSMPAASMKLSDEIVLDETLTDYNCSHIGEQQRSRLSKNLREILLEKNCLSYFVQFLDTKNALSLIKFYLDAESFKTVADQSNASRPQPPSKDPLRKSQQNCDNPDSVSDNRMPVVQSGVGIVGGGVMGDLSLLEATKSTSSEGYDSLSFNSFDVCDRISISSQSESALNSSIDVVQQFDEQREEDAFKSMSDLSNRTLLDQESSPGFYNQRHKMLENSCKNNINCAAGYCRHSSSSVSDRSVVSDAIRIYKKYLITNSPYFIDVPSSILSDLSLELCSRKDDGKISSISANCFEKAQNFVLSQLEKNCLNEFLESVFYCRYCLDIVSSGGLKLADILYSETALFYFMEYLEQENKRNYLEFWMAAMNFRRHYKSNSVPFSKSEALNDAMILYDKYFSLQASCPLSVSDSVRSEIEQRICTDSDEIISCFDLPLQIIEGYFNKNYFVNFLASPLFTNYLKELQIKLEDDRGSIDLPNSSLKQRRGRHRKTLSDCTSDSTISLRNSFISEQNTLLAMETARTTKSLTEHTAIQTKGGDMQIDFRQLTDPDLLWHRNNSTTNGLLTFGRIDALGRYERDFELLNAQDDKWSLSSGSNRLRNAVRKLVNLPEDKVQEEIAWQVAEMIVKDVTNITLGKND